LTATAFWRAALAGATLLVALLAAPAASLAQALEVAPVSVELPRGEMVTTLSVTNRGTQPTPIQVRVFAWDQQGGIDHLTATDGLIVSPPIVEVAPGVAQVIRLVLRRPAGAVEQSFRILLDQIPPAGAPGTVRIALRLSIPVFAEPAARVAEALSWRVEDVGARQGELVTTNSGGRHAKVLNPTLSAPNGTRLTVEPNVNPYVLPGATRRWRSVGRITPGATLRLTATTDAGPIDRTVSVGPGP
jgi:fimbrial chaperone protein